MDDPFLQRLRRFRADIFAADPDGWRRLVTQGQHPKTLFIGCSDSRLMPYQLTGTGPGDLFVVRNVGAMVPPYDGSRGLHGTMAGIEFAVLALKVEHIVVCGHSHCGAVRAAYEGVPEQARALKYWLQLADEALLPVVPGPEALRRTEQRLVVLQMERLMSYPMVRAAAEAGRLALHGWHFVIEDGETHVFDAAAGDFLPASRAPHSGTGPYRG
jgi:carbonic anhydrase